MRTQPLVRDDLWTAVGSLLPKELPKVKGGRPRVPARAVPGDIVFALRIGCPWRLLPQELGCGSGTTCWRRRRDWQATGVWAKRHHRRVNSLGAETAIGWSRASVDSLSVRAKRRASRPVPTRRTAASRGPGTASSWIVMASPWPFASQSPTLTTRPRCFHSSTRFRQSMVPVASQVGSASARPSCAPTGPTTMRPCGVCPVPATSPRASHDGARSD